MSKDIRSFFKIDNKKLSSSSSKKIISDDEIPNSPDVIIKAKDKKAKKRRIIEDSSDEEIFEKDKHTKSKSTKTKTSSTKSKSQKVLKEVSAVDVFGSGPIKRTEIPKKKGKTTEVAIHSDDDFDKTLLELDDANLAERKITSKDETEEHKTKKIIPSTIGITNGFVNKESSNSKTAKNNHSYFENNGKLSPQKSTNKVKDEKNPNKSKNDVPISPKKSNGTEKVSPKKSIDNETIAQIKENVGSKIVTDKNKNDNKRHFSEFLENHEDIVDDEVFDTPVQKSKKQKCSLNESVVSDEERFEKKKHSAMLYQKYLNRSGPKHLGAKQLPQGSPDCLKTMSFVLTGVLESFERDEIVDTIKNLGGDVKSGISKKVTHVLAGDDAGPSKLAKAQELGITVLNEDEFIQLILTKSNKVTKQTDHCIKEGIKEETVKKDKENESKSVKETSHLEKGKTKIKRERENDNIASESELKKNSIKESNYLKNKTSTKSKMDCVNSVNFVQKKVVDEVEIECNESKNSNEDKRPNLSNTLMWVEKYKPQNVKQIIGQHGDASNVKKLMKWLSSWYENRKRTLPKPSPWAKNDDGGYFKAALLSGPPGVGKTTTVSLACSELGFDVVEFNASDTRSKTMLKEQIQELLSTNTLSGYVTGHRAISKKRVLVMDEVDGMAGNEDRGGLQELITLIKSSSIPIICMCNDRNSTKMRSLVNYCYDLKFTRPRVDQIRSYLMSICYKENIKVSPEILTQLITTANQDVRQSITLLSIYSMAELNTNCKKDIKLGPWEAIRKVFSADEHKTMSIHDKSDLFFYDYSLAPLFVQENYLHVVPHCDKKDLLDRFGDAASNISYGDLIESKIRSSGAWGLLPTQAMFSSVIPGSLLSGHIGGQIQFPGWLGKNSRAGKMQRLAIMLHSHTRLSTSGSKDSMLLDYSGHLLNSIANPLIKRGSEGVPDSLKILQTYHLLRDDIDSLVELSVWPHIKDPMSRIEGKVKASLTRAYNKEAQCVPYAPAAFKKSQNKPEPNDYYAEDDELIDEAEDNDSTDNDLLIKKKVSSKSKCQKTETKAEPNKKEKGKKTK